MDAPQAAARTVARARGGRGLIRPPSHITEGSGAGRETELAAERLDLLSAAGRFARDEWGESAAKADYTPLSAPSASQATIWPAMALAATV